MRRIIVFFILLSVSVRGPARNIRLVDTTTGPAITEAGKPVGKIAKQVMNKDGGTLVSENGTLELIIPAGALSKKTSISIQANDKENN